MKHREVQKEVEELLLQERIADKLLKIQKFTLKIQENAIKMAKMGIKPPEWKPSEDDLKIMMQTIVETEEQIKVKG